MGNLPGYRVNDLHWDWLVYVEMFIAGVAAGAYLIAALLEWSGRGRSPLARSAQILAFGLVLLLPILLTVDLARPERFWHMVIQSKTGLPMFKPWSPMSLGSWILVLFGAVTFVSFLDALIARGLFQIGFWRRGNTLHGSTLGLIWTALGALLAFGVGSYSGVLLSATNIPGWASSVLIGALYIATAIITGAAALVLIQAVRGRVDADVVALYHTNAWLTVWWLLVLAAFLATLGDGIRFFLVGGALVAFVVAIIAAGVLPLVLRFVAPRSLAFIPISAALVLLGGGLLRYAIVMGPQSLY